MRGFYERMAKGRGHFVTRADIEERHPRTLAQTLEMVPGSRIIPRQTELGFIDYEVQTGRNVFAGGAFAPSYECPVAFFLDGHRGNRGVPRPRHDPAPVQPGGDELLRFIGQSG